MARIKYGAIIQDISGSIAGHTFQTNAYGSSMRTKPHPPKTVTTSQSGRRAALAVVQAAWAAMSLEAKSLWDLFGTFKHQGAKKNTGSSLSGYNLFLKYNLLRKMTYGDVLTTFSYTAASLTAYASYVKRTGAVLYYNVNPAVDDLNLLVLYYMSKKTRILNRFDKASTRLVYANLFVNTDLNITAAYMNIFGSIPAIADYIQLKEVIISLSSPIVFTPAGHVTIVIS
jgi:hypothetical protein